MNSLSKLALVLTFCTGMIACSGGKAVKGDYGVVPLPQEVTLTNGNPFVLSPSTKIFYPEGNDKMKKNAEFLASYIKEITGYELATATGQPGKGISLVIDQSIQNPEGYQLTVSDNGIRIAGSTDAGVFYGIQTLRKSIPATAQGMNVELPAATINDYPRFAYRGMMLDVSRHFFPVDSVKTYLDILALHNQNTFHWHLSDDQGWRIEIKKYPELAEIGGQLPNNGRKGGYYTQEEFKDLVNYANERFITIIPEVDIPGHTAAVFAAYPDFKNAVKFKTKVNIPGQAFNALDVDDPKAMQFTEDVIAELAALAPGNYIHIGGDEAIGLPHDKFVRFINKTREIVLKNGKKMVGWQETARADISEGDVIQHWIYLKQKSENSSKKKDNIPAEYKEIMALFAEFMKEAPKDPGLGISKKAKVILSPSGYVYLDHKYLEPSADSTQNAEQERLGMAAYEKQTIQEMYDWDPMTFNPTVENPQKDVAGIEAAIWCETITNFRDLQFLLMPRLAGVAEKGWSKVENTHWDEYKVRLGAQAPLWEKADWNYFKSSLVDWK